MFSAPLGFLKRQRLLLLGGNHALQRQLLLITIASFALGAWVSTTYFGYAFSCTIGAQRGFQLEGLDWSNPNDVGYLASIEQSTHRIDALQLPSERQLSSVSLDPSVLRNITWNHILRNGNVWLSTVGALLGTLSFIVFVMVWWDTSVFATPMIRMTEDVSSGKQQQQRQESQPTPSPPSGAGSGRLSGVQPTTLWRRLTSSLVATPLQNIRRRTTFVTAVLYTFYACGMTLQTPLESANLILTLAVITASVFFDDLPNWVLFPTVMVVILTDLFLAIQTSGIWNWRGLSSVANQPFTSIFAFTLLQVIRAGYIAYVDGTHKEAKKRWRRSILWLFSSLGQFQWATMQLQLKDWFVEGRLRALTAGGFGDVGAKRQLILAHLRQQRRLHYDDDQDENDQSNNGDSIEIEVREEEVQALLHIEELQFNKSLLIFVEETALIDRLSYVERRVATAKNQTDISCGSHCPNHVDWVGLRAEQHPLPPRCTSCELRELREQVVQLAMIYRSKKETLRRYFEAEYSRLNSDAEMEFARVMKNCGLKVAGTMWMGEAWAHKHRTLPTTPGRGHSPPRTDKEQEDEDDGEVLSTMGLQMFPSDPIHRRLWMISLRFRDFASHVPKTVIDAVQSQQVHRQKMAIQRRLHLQRQFRNKVLRLHDDDDDDSDDSWVASSGEDDDELRSSQNDSDDDDDDDEEEGSTTDDKHSRYTSTSGGGGGRPLPVRDDVSVNSDVVVKRATSGDTVLHRRVCTVLYVTVFNFPHENSRDGSEASMNFYDAAGWVGRFDGTLDSVSPDSFIASFNGNRPCKRHAHVACKCALMIAAELQKYPELQVVMAIDTGEHLVGRTGSVEFCSLRPVCAGWGQRRLLMMIMLAASRQATVVITEATKKAFNDTTFDCVPLDVVLFDTDRLNPTFGSATAMASNPLVVGGGTPVYELLNERRGLTTSIVTLNQAFGKLRQGDVDAALRLVMSDAAGAHPRAADLRLLVLRCKAMGWNKLRRLALIWLPTATDIKFIALWKVAVALKRQVDAAYGGGGRNHHHHRQYRNPAHTITPEQAAHIHPSFAPPSLSVADPRDSLTPLETGIVPELDVPREVPSGDFPAEPGSAPLHLSIEVATLPSPGANDTTAAGGRLERSRRVGQTPNGVAAGGSRSTNRISIIPVRSILPKPRGQQSYVLPRNRMLPEGIQEVYDATMNVVWRCSNKQLDGGDKTYEAVAARPATLFTVKKQELTMEERLTAERTEQKLRASRTVLGVGPLGSLVAINISRTVEGMHRQRNIFHLLKGIRHDNVMDVVNFVECVSHPAVMTSLSSQRVHGPYGMLQPGGNARTEEEAGGGDPSDEDGGDGFVGINDVGGSGGVEGHSSRPSTESSYLIFEYAAGGSLKRLLTTFGQRPLPPRLVGKYVREILLGLRQLHQRRLVHRAVSTSSILLSTDGICKLGHFRWASQQQQPHRVIRITPTFTPTAPQHATRHSPPNQAAPPMTVLGSSQLLHDPSIIAAEEGPRPGFHEVGGVDKNEESTSLGKRAHHPGAAPVAVVTPGGGNAQQAAGAFIGTDSSVFTHSDGSVLALAAASGGSGGAAAGGEASPLIPTDFISIQDGGRSSDLSLEKKVSLKDFGPNEAYVLPPEYLYPDGAPGRPPQASYPVGCEYAHDIWSLGICTMELLLGRRPRIWRPDGAQVPVGASVETLSGGSGQLRQLASPSGSGLERVYFFDGSIEDFKAALEQDMRSIPIKWPAARAFIRGCLNMTPSKRKSIDELMAMPFVAAGAV